MKKKSRIDLNYIMGKPTLPLEKFHDKTKFKKWYPHPPLKDWPKTWTTTYFKEYPRLDKVLLPPVQPLDSLSYQEVLYRRHSNRTFSKTPLTLDQISQLIHYSGGIRYYNDLWAANRMYASPGGRYTLEVYLLSLNSELPMGLYHYSIRNHSLDILTELNQFETMYYFNQEWIANASVVLFFTGNFARNTIKYGTRGYRHVIQEAGHLGQNFYLTATAMELSVCAIGGYMDDRINQLLDVDGIKETVIYVMGIGNYPK